MTTEPLDMIVYTGLAQEILNGATEYNSSPCTTYARPGCGAVSPML